MSKLELIINQAGANASKRISSQRKCISSQATQLVRVRDLDYPRVERKGKIMNLIANMDGLILISIAVILVVQLLQQVLA